jgi:hypothetical protein
MAYQGSDHQPIAQLSPVIEVYSFKGEVIERAFNLELYRLTASLRGTNEA